MIPIFKKNRPKPAGANHLRRGPVHVLNEVPPMRQRPVSRRIHHPNVSIIIMKDRLAHLALLVALLVALTPIVSHAQRTERTFKVTPGKQLSIDLRTGGEITIIGWDKNEVSATVDRDGWGADGVDIDIDERKSGIYIHADYTGGYRHRGGDLTLEVHVPHRFDVDVETMGGDLTIRGVEGELDGRTMGGDLSLSGLKGTIDLTTMGGEIELTDSEVDGTVHTMGGEVLIEDVTGNVKGTTMGGEVTYRNVHTGADGGEVRVKTMGGDINVDDAGAGANVHTMGGDIHVHSAADHVKAKTMGGDIDVDRIDGWIEATTMGGDIDVKMVGDAATGDRHVELTSMGGDVELTVPAGLSMDIDIELVYTRDARRNYRIESDFDIKKERTTEWEYHDGDARKYIYGTGKIGGGKNAVHIKTTNGNVILRRGS